MRVLLPVGVALAMLMGLIGWSVSLVAKKPQAAPGQRPTGAADDLANRKIVPVDPKHRQDLPEMKEVWERLEDKQRNQIRSLVERMTGFDG